MTDWFLERLKSFAGGFAAAMTTATIKGIEQALGIDISTANEVAAVSFISGFVVQQIVYWLPNKPMGKP